jgi:GDP-mannose pyrophosphatase NudK
VRPRRQGSAAKRLESELPRIVESELVYDGWNRLDIITVEAVDGDGAVGRHRRELVDHGEAAVVLVVERQRGVAVLVRQWRTGLIGTGVDPYLLEACAGIIDPGETPEETARRETEEEIGITVGRLRSLGSVLPSAGTLTERMHLYVAEVSAADLSSRGRGNAHEGENIEVVEVPIAELYEMARQGAIEDAKTLIIVQRLMLEEREASLPG